MKKFKDNNKGFSLVELIVVIAIMVVLIAVLGSTILGYVDKSKYSKDLQALDAVNTAVKSFVAEPESKYTNGTTYTLSALMQASMDESGVLNSMLAEIFNDAGDFENASNVFSNINTGTVYVCITDGAVAILAPMADGTDEDKYDPYEVGDTTTINVDAAVGPTTSGTTGSDS